MSITKVYIPAEEVEAYLEAALNGNTTEVSVMLNRRWYMVDVPSEDNDTALMLATWNGNIETMDMLCQHNASTFTTNDDNENVFDQIPALEDTELMKLNHILHGSRNEEIETWNDPHRQYNRVMYERNHKDGGVWCSYQSEETVHENISPYESGMMMCTCP